MLLRTLVLALLVACGPKSPPAPWTVGADGAPVVPDDLATPFPVDPLVRIGHLDNGLTYFIEHNERPAKRAELRMVVRAGSILEDEDQRGIAHFLEHMAFNGSKNFPGTSVVYELEAVGARFGAHVNASTGFDETTFKLQVPTDKPGAVELALRVFADQAMNLTFDPDECAREIGVVTEEWRLDQGLGQRVQDASFPLLFHNSLYVDRLPIGTADSVKKFSCDAAKRFWQDWYRPDLMAVMVAGDVNVAKTEALITELFSPMQMPANPRPREIHRVPDHEEALVAVVADPEITSSTVTVLDKVDDVEGDTHASYRQIFVEQMAWAAINDRLAALSQDPASPFTAAGGGPSGLGFERAAFAVNAAAKEGRELEALDALMVEVERARRYGFTDVELDRARAMVGIGMQTYYAERDTTESVDLVEEHIRVFTTHEPMPGVVYEYAMAQKYVPTISRDDVNAWVRSAMLTGRSRVVMMLMPQKAGLAVPDKAEVLRRVDAVRTQKIDPPADSGPVAPLMRALPEPGVVNDAGKDNALGTITWKLGNGVTVILKPTDFVADQVLFEAFSPGGTSLVADADYIPAITATDIVARSGLGEHDAISLARTLAGEDVAVSPWISSLHEGLSGGTAVRDLETMFQLIHLNVTAPRFDPVAFELEKQTRAEDLRNRTNNPDAWLWDTFESKMWQGNPRYTNWTMDDLGAMDLGRSAAVYRDRFADLSDMTFVFVGAFTPDQLRPLVARYLASLPGGGRAEVARDDGARMAPGRTEETVPAGDTPRSRVLISFHAEIESNWISRTTLDALREVLAGSLGATLREELGGTYGVSVQQVIQDGPYETFRLDIDFQCDPARTDALIAAAWEVIDRVRGAQVNQRALDVMREQRRRDRETEARDNSFWVSEIANALQRGEDPREILNFDARNKALDADDISILASRLLRDDAVVQIVQRP
jgi:zinc protease